MNRQTELAESAWKEVRNCLENRKRRIYEEIMNYPPPITACDEQFNCLLDEQARICHELDRMREAVEASLTRRATIELIDEFIQSSSYLDDEVRRRIRSSLKEELSKLES